MRVRLSAALALLALTGIEASAQQHDPDAPAGGHALAGTRDQQIAQLLEGLVANSANLRWTDLDRLFPGAEWQAPNRSFLYDGTPWVSQRGEIGVDGIPFSLELEGSSDRIDRTFITAPSYTSPALAWAGIERALSARGVETALIACATDRRGSGFRMLTKSGRSALINFYADEENGGGGLSFDFLNPYNPAESEAGLRQMLADRCRRP